MGLRLLQNEGESQEQFFSRAKRVAHALPQRKIDMIYREAAHGDSDGNAHAKADVSAVRGDVANDAV